MAELTIPSPTTSCGPRVVVGRSGYDVRVPVDDRSARAADGTAPLATRWRSVHDLAEAWCPPTGRTVVVAPHPDDETLGAGGLIADRRARGLDVVVVAVTDGDAAYDAGGDPALAAVRRDEQLAALDALGCGPDTIVRLGVGDGRAPANESTIADRLAALLDVDDLLVAPWVGDHHSDHEAVGRAGVDAARRVGCRHVSWLFWAWHHADPATSPGGRPLLRFELSGEDRRRKSTALDRHVSQRRPYGASPPILSDELVEPVTWPAEFFVPGSETNENPVTT